MTEKELGIWQNAMEKIGYYLRLARYHMTRQEWTSVRTFLDLARNVYKEVRHLKPPPVSAPRGTGPWVNKSGLKGPRSMPGKPVNIDALRGSNLRLFCRLDPFLLLQIEDMVMDYLYSHYGTPQQNWDRAIDKGSSELYWIDVINGRSTRSPQEYRQEYYSRFTT